MTPLPLRISLSLALVTLLSAAAACAQEPRPLDVTVSTAPSLPRAGEPTRLTFAMSAGDARVLQFDTVHEKKLHLLMVSKDLSWFAHEHPALQPNGTFTLDFAFPRGGAYRLFADFKPTGGDGVVLRRDLQIDGAAWPAQPLRVSDLTVPRVAGDREVRLTSGSPAVGGDAKLTFEVSKGGSPANDLEPYLGAMGHLVIMEENGETLLHAHPEDHPGSTATPGAVSFHTRFPSAGLYKAWAQFQANGEIVIADFVLDVRAAPHGGDAHAAGHAHHAHGS